jgi:hypothetical protein
VITGTQHQATLPRALIAAILLCAALLGFHASPAAAASAQPDAWVRYKSFKSQTGTYVEPTEWVGDDRYNRTGRYQKAQQRAGGSYAPDAHFVFEVRVQNDGSSPDRFRVGASGSGDWVVKYFRDAADITSSVEAGTYRTASLGAGQGVTLKVKVWLGDPTTQVVRIVRLISEANGAKQDAVKVKVSYSGCSC